MSPFHVFLHFHLICTIKKFIFQPPPPRMIEIIISVNDENDGRPLTVEDPRDVGPNSVHPTKVMNVIWRKTSFSYRSSSTCTCTQKHLFLSTSAVLLGLLRLLRLLRLLDTYAAKTHENWPPCTCPSITLLLLPITGYKIKDDSIFLGTFLMSCNALLTHISRYYCIYYSVRLTENTINPLFIIYFTSRDGEFFNKPALQFHAYQEQKVIL